MPELMTRQQLAACLVSTGRWTVVLVAVLALAVSGASAAERMFSARNAPDTDAATGSEHDRLVPTPGTEEPVDGMAGGGGACTEQDAYLQAPVILYNVQTQLKAELPAALTPASSGSIRSSRLPGFASTAGRVSGVLAHRFTLVGARPSGTS